LSLLSILALQKIDRNEIDHALARGAVQDDDKKIAGKKFLRSTPFLVFTASAVLFHFANAAMLPLAGQYIVARNNNVNASVYMSACIIVAQLVMVPVALFCGRFSSRGRKPWMIICFLALPLRGFLYTLSADPYYITSIQILDGLAAGIFGVMSVLTIADITKGTGQFNLANSILITAVGIGASLSGAVAGFVAQEFSIEVAFLFLSGVALAALIVYGIFMRETLKTVTPTIDDPAAG
jgi:predicted MFS family arabinose efflux permease